MNKITYSDAVQFLNTVVLEGLRSVTDGKYINAEKSFIKAVRITRQLNKLKKFESRNNKDVVKTLQLENDVLKKKLKEKDQK